MRMNLDQQRLCIELQHLDWARQLKEEIIEDIATSAKLMGFQAGQVVIELDSEINTVYFVVAGRLDGELFDRLGKEIHCDTFQRGSVVGLFSVLLPDRSHLHVQAVEPTTVIQLALDELLRLTAKYREFQLAMFRRALYGSASTFPLFTRSPSGPDRDDLVARIAIARWNVALRDLLEETIIVVFSRQIFDAVHDALPEPEQRVAEHVPGLVRKTSPGSDLLIDPFPGFAAFFPGAVAPEGEAAQAMRRTTHPQPGERRAAVFAACRQNLAVLPVEVHRFDFVVRPENMRDTIRQENA
jgi:hypothetical protein